MTDKATQYKEALLSTLIQMNGDAQANLVLKDIIIADLDKEIAGYKQEIYVLNEMIKNLKSVEAETEEE